MCYAIAAMVPKLKLKGCMGWTSRFLHFFREQNYISSGLNKTLPFRLLLVKSVVLDWFMVRSCILRWSFICQNLAVNARNRAKITKIKSDVLETLDILMPDQRTMKSR